LVPIALAYHLAHYLSYLLLAGQFILPQASDPLGLGWDLFGTANWAIDIGIVSIKAVWWIAVVAVVVGHVYAVYLAHVMALLPGPCHGPSALRQRPGGAPEPAAPGAADGGLHHDQPVDPLPAHR
jgi:hypothetical protein